MKPFPTLPCKLLSRTEVQPNDGFKTGLIGPPELIADRIRQYYEVGVDLILCSFLHFADELPEFGRSVIPLVRSLNAVRHEADVITV
jgi:dimethylsulfone monooxygenase